MNEENENEGFNVTRNKWVNTTNVGKLWPISEKFNEKRVFYIGPFWEPFNSLYTLLIKPVVESYDLECYRDDEKKVSEVFLPRILERIKTSRFVIADLSLDRPNVLYEQGWVSAMGTPSLIFTSTERPSDLKLITIERYDFTEKGLKKLEILIRDTLEQETVDLVRKEMEIDFSKIIQKYQEKTIEKEKIKLGWAILEENEDLKVTFDNEIKIKKTTIYTKKELELEPVDLNQFDDPNIVLSLKAKLAISLKKYEEYKTECIDFNNELEKKKVEIDSYILKETVFREGKKVLLAFFNDGIKNLNDGFIECFFPENVLIYEDEVPERPVKDLPKIQPYFIEQQKSFLSSISSVFLPSLSDRTRRINLKGPFVENEKMISMEFNTIKHHSGKQFPKYIIIAAFESGNYIIEWNLYLEKTPEPVVGYLNLIVEE